MVLPSAEIHRVAVTTPFGSSRKQAEQLCSANMVLSETFRRYLFLVVRGGIRATKTCFKGASFYNVFIRRLPISVLTC